MRGLGSEGLHTTGQGQQCGGDWPAASKLKSTDTE